MKLVRLTPETVLDGFDCGDEDLNNFLVEDAKEIKGGFPERKQFGSYPPVKIGRFAVSSKYKGRNIDTDLMNLLTDMLNGNPNYSALRYLTVDDYLSAIDFYLKNNFKVLSEKIQNDHTRLMFFDMMELE